MCQFVYTRKAAKSYICMPIYTHVYTYRCEIMATCGWRENYPTNMYGLELSRVGAMDLFLKLRQQKGIRAHFWP